MTVPARPRAADPEMSGLFLKFAIAKTAVIVVALAVFIYTHNVLWLAGIAAGGVLVVGILGIRAAQRLLATQRTATNGPDIVQYSSGRF